MSAVHSATVLTINGCSLVCTHTVGVFALPVVQASASPDSIFCVGEIINLNASSNQNVSYLWSSGATTSVTQITAPVGTSHYTVTVSDNNGCEKSAAVKVMGFECTGIKNEAGTENSLEIFPNPSKEFFTIKANHTLKGKIINELGQTIRDFFLNTENDFTQLVQGLPKGIYFVEADGKALKMLVQ